MERISRPATRASQQIPHFVLRLRAARRGSHPLAPPTGRWSPDGKTLAYCADGAPVDITPSRPLREKPGYHRARPMMTGPVEKKN